MYRFLLTPKWLVGHILLLVTLVVFVNLGFWQLHRLDERRELNARINDRISAAPLPLGELLARTGDDPDALAYRRVRAEGRYQPGEELLTAPRSRDGQPGQQVLTPLLAGGGITLLVERGWIPFERSAPQPETFAAPTGRVAVEGILLPPEPGDVGGAQAVQRIVPEQLGALSAYLSLQGQNPAQPGQLPRLSPEPEPSEGNHLSYAIQWFSFTVIAAAGYPLLLRHTAREQARGAQPGERRNAARERAPTAT